MALSAPVYAGSATDATAGATSVSFNTTATAAADDLLVFLGGVGGSGGNQTLVSVSCGGLTWTVNDTILRGTVMGTGIGYATAPSGLASGTGLTATWTGSAGSHLGAVYIISGAATSSIRDTGGTLNTAATATPTLTGLTTTNAKDIICAVRMAVVDTNTDATWTAGTNYTRMPTVATVIDAATTRVLMMEYQIVATAGTRSASLTQTAIACVMAATVFKEGAAAAVVLPERITPRTRT